MSLCILCVDDSEADQFICEYTLNEFDDIIELHKAYDGQEALNLIRKEHITPDVILLDINMPRMGGLQFLSIFNQLKLSKPVKIFMLSSSIQEQERQQCKVFPEVVDCLSKPLSQEQLSTILSLEK